MDQGTYSFLSTEQIARKDPNCGWGCKNNSLVDKEDMVRNVLKVSLLQLIKDVQ